MSWYLWKGLAVLCLPAILAVAVLQYAEWCLEDWRASRER